MGSRGELKPAADHRAVQHGDHRHGAEFDTLESAMPGARVFDAFEGIALGKFGKIEPGAEVFAVAGKHHSADIVRQITEKNLDAVHHRIVKRVALLSPR